MAKRKVVLYAFIVVFILSLVFNYVQYVKNESFKIQLGAEYLNLTRSTLFNLEDLDAGYWIDTLNKEDGDVILERHIGKLNQYSGEFHRINGKTSTIGILLDSLTNHYYDLNESIKNGDDIDELAKVIDEEIQFIQRILTKIDSDLGEKEKLWYKELAGNNTKTQKYLLDEIKDFEEILKD